VPITTKVVCLNPADGEVYSIQEWFFPGTPVSSTNKTLQRYIWNIIESDVKHHKPNPI